MRKLVLVAMMAALMGLGACAQHDPNLRVRELRELSRPAGDYTLSLKTYDLDEKGMPRLVSEADPSLAGFISRTLAPQGLSLKAGGPAKYTMEAHLLCANARRADMGIRSEEVRIPAQAVGAGYHEELHYWLPGEADPGTSRDAMARRENQGRRRHTGGLDRPDEMSLGGTQRMSVTPPPCQGRVLLLITPAGAGPVREVFVSRGSTADCSAVEGCPVNACRDNLERELVDLLERRR